MKSSIVLIVIWAIAFGLTSAISGQGGQILRLPITVAVCFFVFAIQWLAFIPAYLKQTERYYDLTGSLSFISACAVLVISSEALSVFQLMLAGIVCIWAMRLGSFLFYRICQDGVDSRFNDIKPNPLRFFITWNMQGLWVVVTLAPVFVVLSSSVMPTINFTFYAGTTLAILGIVIESIADWQKRQFKRSDSSLPFITTGLWAHSRHPNYFGEIVVWLGVALASFSWLHGLACIALVSPVFVILLLTKVSGVPLLENKADARWGSLSAYQDYKRKTPVLVPFMRK